MTREEHISNLETIGCDGWTVTTEAYKSLQFAIKALKQEPCEDCISRKAALDLFEQIKEEYPKIYTAIEVSIRLLPSVTPNPKEIYNKGWEDGAEATAYHVELCEEENPTIPLSVIEDIKANIKLAKYASKDMPERALIYSNGWDDALDVAIDVIDKHIAERGSK